MKRPLGRGAKGTAKRLPESHPAYDLVSQRTFEDLRENDLAPRPLRESRPSGSGRVSTYPPTTRAQVERFLELKDRGVHHKAKARILLWLDGFWVPDARIEADLTAWEAAITS